MCATMPGRTDIPGAPIQPQNALRTAHLGEKAQEHRPPLLEHGELSPVLFQLAVGLLQLGPRLPFPEQPLTMPGC
jgi:hypothetical protein